MIIVAGTVRFEPAQLAAARGAIHDVVTQSRAEDGCITYAYSIDVLDPSLVHVFEVWRDRAALEAHFRQAHLVVWRQSWNSLGLRDRRLRIYEISGSSEL